MIRTVDLVKEYGRFRAVNKINLNIPPGQIYGFLGPNGAGKTSTIMMLLGVNRPTSGDIYLFDEKYSPSRMDLRKSIGVVPEKHPRGMWRWMTAYEYLEFFGEFFDIPNLNKRIKYLMEKVDLGDCLYNKFSSFSRGMIQKMSIVRALLHDPDILFLDEPISGLDPLGIKKVRDLILSENREGRTIFISSHLLSEMEKICHKVAIIYKGELIAEDQMDVLLHNLAENKEIFVELESIDPALIGDFKSLDFVQDVVNLNGRLLLTVPKEGDFRKKVSEFLIKKGIVPLGIQEKALSLEDAFTTITKENVQLIAGLGGTHES